MFYALALHPLLHKNIVIQYYHMWEGFVTVTEKTKCFHQTGWEDSDQKDMCSPRKTANNGLIIVRF